MKPAQDHNDKALAYARVSTTQQQKDGKNLDSQLAEIRLYCEKRGYDLVGTYEDILSGAKADRLGYYELLNRLEKGDAQVVVAYEVSRFGRNSLDNAWLMVKAQEYGLRVETVTGGRDFASDPEGELLYDVLTAVAKFERRSILQRMERGRKAAHERGHVVSMAPFGYDLSGPRGKKELKPNQWAPLVREMFRLHRKGWGVCALKTWLSKQGTGRKWTPRAVTYILHNPVYHGWLTYRGQRVKGTHEPLSSAAVSP